jgi:hypothetical protein
MKKSKIKSILHVVIMQKNLIEEGNYKANALPDLKKINPCIGDIQAVHENVVRYATM